MKNLFSHIPAPMYIYDPDSLKILAVNDAFIKHYGYSEADALSLRVPDLFPESEQEILLNLIKNSKGYFQITGDWHHICRDGSILNVVAHSHCVEYREKISQITLLTDVTEMKKTEKELEVERTLLMTFIRTIPDPIWVKDHNGVYLICNPALERIFGAKESEIVGKTDYDFVDKEKADSFRESDYLAIQGNVCRKNEEMIRYADTGNYGLFETIKTPMYDSKGELLGIFGLARDISEIRKSQHDLQERVKEQICLYEVFALTEDMEAGISEIFQQVAERIPYGWQFPEITEVQIQYHDRVFKTANFKETQWMQKAEAVTEKNRTVKIIVVYREERAFLKEEASLLFTIAHRLIDFINRRNAVETFKENEQLMSAMFSQTTDSIVLVDAETGNFVDFNDSAHVDLGYSREEFSLLHVKDIQAEHSEEKIRDNTQNAAAGNPLEFETVHRHKNGTLRNVKLRMKPISIGGRPIISAVWRDITEQKIKEKEIESYRLHLEELVASRTKQLEAINQEQSAIFDSATTGIAMIKDWVILRCNRKLEEIFGYGPGELIGRRTRIWYDSEESFLNFDRELAEGLQRQGIYEKNELLLYKKNGDAFWIRTKVQLLNKAEPEKGLVAVMEDITLERQIAEDLLLAKETAEEGTCAKSSFLANMSHEIRTPMNAVIGLTHLLMKTGLTGKQRDYLNKIQNSGQHLLNIINDILDFSKIEAGKLTVENAAFNLEELLGNVSSFINGRAVGKGLELIFDISPNIPQNLIGDSLRIGQILLNFGSNAVKFTEKGEVTIIARIKKKTENGILLYFAVKDTGIGLSGEQQEQMFQSFQQADMSTTRKYGGTGLGLAISKRLAELMKGEIGLESEPGKGSTFWFTVDVGIDQNQKNNLLPDSDFRGFRALVVDDNDSARVIMSYMLKTMTFTAIDVSSGEDALKEIEESEKRNEPIEIIFMDWQMPGMDGIETIKRIQAMKLKKNPYTIMVTAFGRDEILDQINEVSINEILTKPVTPSMLYNASVRTIKGEMNRGFKPNETESQLEDRLKTINGSEILLVEDNEINQEVAVDLLTGAGLRVDTAENGLAALTKIENKEYDLVLMDMQMPLMDGIIATGEIRKKEKWANLPIVAMTANAMQQDRIACIEAGMNDFIPKPIEPVLLWTVLLKWIKPNRSIEKHSVVKETIAEIESDLPDRILGIDMEQGLRRVLGKKSLYLSLLRRFLTGRKHAAEEILAALNENDMMLAERLAHTIKGISGNIGAVDLFNVSADLESAIRNNMPRHEIDVILSNFDSTIKLILSDLSEKLPPENQNSSFVEINRDKLLKVCSRLVELLKEDEAAAVDLMEENKEILASAFPLDYLEILLETKAFNFEKALNALDKSMRFSGLSA